jgi:hypothetical protein
MTKSKKSANKARTRKQTRRSIDWKKFFKLCQNGLTNAELAEAMGYKLDKSSEDALKPIRAMRSRAQTVGIRIDGKLTKLRAPKSGTKKPAKVAKPKKERKPKVAKPKAEPKPANESLAVA